LIILLQIQKNLEIELLDKCIQLSDRCVSPTVGETTVTEIITGYKRPIEWLLEPWYQKKSQHLITETANTQSLLIISPFLVG
jgi:hypothetical protein